MRVSKSLFGRLFIFNTLDIGTPQSALRYTYVYAKIAQLCQAIDVSGVDVCRREVHLGALRSYPAGDDVSLFIRCVSSAGTRGVAQHIS